MSIGKRSRQRVQAAMVAVLLVVGAVPALAVIKIDFPVSRVYKEAAIVAVGEVVRVNAGRSVECAIRETLKGQLPDSKLMVDAPTELARGLRTAQPVVVFIQGDRAIFHLADSWHEGASRAGGRWEIAGPYPMVKNYPGRTEGLASLVRQIQAGKPGIQDGIGHEFIGTIQDRGNLSVKPTFLAAADLNGDGDIDLLVGTAQGVRLFLAKGSEYTDVTERWGLQDASGKHGVTGDVTGDGKPDLLLGRTLWLRESDRFVKSRLSLELPAEDTWAAAALADANGDKLQDVVVLTRTGSLKTAINPGAGAWVVKTSTLWTDGPPALAAVLSQDWGDDGALYVLVVHPADIVRYPIGSATAPRSDFRRLTGIPLSEYRNIGPLPLRVDLCTALDYDGNGRQDLLVLTGGGGVTLANRGYGAMLINGFLHTQLRCTSTWKDAPRVPKLPFELAPSVHVAAGKKAGRSGKGNAQNLLILRGDGQLFEMVNER